MNLGFKLNRNENRLRTIADKDKYLNSMALSIDLFYEEGKGKIDLSVFKNLKWLGCNYKEIVNLSSQIDLESLVLFNYSDFGELKKLTNISELILRKGNVKNLLCIKNCSKIINLELSYLSKLNSILEMTSLPVLEYLEIYSCKNIEDLIPTLSKLKNLKALKLIKMSIEEISWVKELHELEQLVICESNIISGDISPARDIDYVAIDNKRHYNYRFDDELMKIFPK